MTSSIRTQSLNSPEEFGHAVEQLRADLSAAGRDPAAVDIQVEVPVIDFGAPDAVPEALARLDELADLGATWAIVHVDASSVKAAAEYLIAFSDAVICAPEPPPRDSP